MDSKYYALLADKVYTHIAKGITFEASDGRQFEVVDFYSNPLDPSGYYGAIYKDLLTGNLIVAHRGTEFDSEWETKIKDLVADGQMATDQINQQIAGARFMMRQALELAATAGVSVSVTGHSLGGALAQVTAYENTLYGETFNAYGAAGQYGTPSGGAQVVNYIRVTDMVAAAGTHFGEVRAYATEEDVRLLFLDDVSGLLPLLSDVVQLGPQVTHSAEQFYGTADYPLIVNQENLERYEAAKQLFEVYRAQIWAAAHGIDFVLSESGLGYPLSKFLNSRYEDALAKTAFLGTAAIDELSGTAAADYMNGLGSNDRFSGGAGDDLIYGGADTDTLRGEADNDHIDGGAGNDYLNGGSGNDHLYGGDGNDQYDFALADFFARPGSSDLISDSDGAGMLTIDGVQMVVGERLADNSWQSLDDKFKLSVVQMSVGLMLIIEHVETGSTILVENWNDGTFGMYLGGEVEEPVTNRGEIFGGGNDSGDVHEIQGSSWVDHADDSHKLVGNQGNDGLAGGYVDDVLEGGDDNDHIEGGGGADHISGGAGNDYITNFDGYFTWATWIQVYRDGAYITIPIEQYISERAAADSSIFSHGKSWYLSAPNASSGDVTQFYQSVAMITFATTYDTQSALHVDGADIIDGGIGSDLVFGGKGDDIINGGQDNDVLVGGRDNDYISGDSGNDVIFGDRIYGNLDESWHNGITEVTGNDLLFGGLGDDQIYGQGGSDTIFGQDGDDTLRGDRYDDVQGSPATISEAAGDDYIDGGAGADYITGNAGNDTLFGGDGDDEIQGDDLATAPSEHGNDDIDAGEGDDTVWGGAGNDVIRGGSGNDTLSGDYNAVQLGLEHHGNDFIYGDAGNDILIGDGGNDYLDGGEDDDELHGKEGSDRLLGGAGLDQLVGGAGNDALDGGAGNDKLWGEDGSDLLTGADGADELQGGEGNDSLDGGVGDDKLWGDAGNDALEGGAGNDQLAGGAGDDSQSGGIGDDILNGNAGMDVLRGGDGNDNLSGNEDNDTVDGGAGNDYVGGDQGNDLLSGGAGNDNLYGGVGNDRLEGGAGQDYLDGGAGNDTHVVSASDGFVDTIVDDQANNRVSILASRDRVTFTLNDFDGSIWIEIDGVTAATIVNGMSSAIKQFDFQDGTTLSLLDLMDGYEGSVFVQTTQAGAMLVGSGNYDSLSGKGGDSVFQGGRGDDSLNGTATSVTSLGGNVYVYNVGDGNDTITDIGNRTRPDGTPAPNTVRFGEGISAQDIKLSFVGYPQYVLVLSIGSTGGSIKLKNFSQTNALSVASVDRFEFADGTSLTYQQLLARGFDIVGVDGTNLDDRMTGTSGNDVISARSGNDIIDAGDGNDTLGGGEGVNILRGGAGDDTYLHQYGTDTIVEEVGGGNDTVEVRGSYTLDIANVENVLLAANSSGTLIGNGVGNVLTGQGNADILRGMAGNDSLIADGGNDVLEGGLGDDYLRSDWGTDTYQYRRGDGNDVIHNGDAWQNSDKLVLADIASTEVSALRVGDNVILTVPGATAGTFSTITLKEYFTPESYETQFKSGRLAQIECSDGVFLTPATFASLPVTFSESADLYSIGLETGEVLSSLGGDDRLYAKGGADTLIGGTGNDYLAGGAGNDLYVYNGGDGSDRIVELAGEGNDILRFGAGITSAQMRFTYSTTSYSVYISFGEGTTDSIELVNFLSEAGGIDSIEFDDGTVWTRERIIRDLYGISENRDDIYGSYGDDEINGGGGNDKIDGSIGDDTLIGGAGDDNLIGGWGTYDDTMDGGQGFDIMDGGNGNDTYHFGLDSNTDLVYEAGGADKVLMGAGILPEGVTLYRGTGSQLFVVINATGNWLALSGFFVNDAQKVEEIVFENGVRWNVQYMLDNCIPMTSELVFYGDFNNYVDETLQGDDFSNYFNGYRGADTMIGGKGDDRYYFSYANSGSSGDLAIENANEGIDSIYSESFYTALPDNVENLYALYYSQSWEEYDSYSQRFVQLPRTSRGNALDNIIDVSATAFGSYTFPIDSGIFLNLLDGGGGKDTLIGSFNSDIYVVDSADDIIVETDTRENQRVDTVRASYSYSLAWNNALENLELYGQGNISGTGNARDNFIDGSTSSGANVLSGGAGNDTYQVGAGDTVVESAGDGSDTVVVNFYGNHALNTYGNVENMSIGRLAGDSEITGNAGNNILRGNNYSNTIRGLGGDDVLYADAAQNTAAHHDVLDGGDGNDTLNGGYTANNSATFIGGRGDDLLINGSLYLYVQGDGSDTIRDVAGQGTIQFGPGISAADIAFIREGENLILQIGSLITDRILIEDYFSIYGQAIGRLEFSDGTVLTGPDMLARIGQWVTGTSADDQLDGGDGVEAFFAGDGNDVVNGGGAADTLHGEAGDDVLNGGAGADTLVGGAGNDTMAGGEGDDVYYSESLGDTISEAAGGGVDTLVSTVNRTLIANIENLVLAGAATDAVGNDLDNDIRGNGLGNILRGGAGADTLRGGDGADRYLYGLGDGADTILEAAGAQGGADELVFDEGIDQSMVTVKRTQAGNFIDVEIGGNTIRLGTDGAGDSLVETIRFHDGSTWNVNEVAIPNNPPVVVSGIPEQDAVEGQAFSLLLPPGLFSDEPGESLEISIDYMPWWMQYDAQTGLLSGTPPMDETGTDYVSVVATDSWGQTAYLQFDVTVLNYIGGGTGSDTLNGTSGRDAIFGYEGNDTLSGGSGRDRLIGGQGDDTYTVDNAGDVIVELSGEGSDTVRSSVTYTLAENLENLTLTGSSGITAFGNHLANILTGNSGANTLDAGEGNDTLDGKAGADTMNGGSGDDSYIVDNAGDTVVEITDQGYDSVSSSVSYTLGANVEKLTLTGSSAINATGNAGANALIGNSAINTLTGGDGDDLLDGKGGADILVGGIGNDNYVVDNSGDSVQESAGGGIDSVQSSLAYTLGGNVENLTITGTGTLAGTGNTLDNNLVGGSGSNSLSALAGNDTLDGKAGIDTLTGGTGNDTYFMARTYGSDTVVENDATAGVLDVARFLTGVAYDQLWFKRPSGSNNLEITIIGTTDKLVIKDWYLGAQYRVEEIRTDDGGKVLQAANVQALVNAMAAMTQPPQGQTTLTPAQHATLDPVFASTWQNQTFAVFETGEAEDLSSAPTQNDVLGDSPVVLGDASPAPPSEAPVASFHSMPGLTTGNGLSGNAPKEIAGPASFGMDPAEQRQRQIERYEARYGGGMPGHAERSRELEFLISAMAGFSPATLAGALPAENQANGHAMLAASAL